MGVVWEQQICLARATPGSHFVKHGECLHDESLLTIMTEVEGILNSWLLNAEVIDCLISLHPLLPVNILTMKSKVV